jgi:hypothetical protein
MPGDPTANYDQACTCIQWLNPLRNRADALAAQRGRRLRERHHDDARRLTLRGDVLNLLDDTAFNSPQITLGTPTLGQIRADAGVLRTVQLMIRAGW